MITFHLDLKYDDAKTVRKVQAEIAPQLQALFESKIPQINRAVVRILEKNVRAQKEWYSVARGQMRMQFGLPNSLRNIQNILSQWLASIEVKMKKIRSGAGGIYSGGISIRAVRASYADVFAVSDAVFTTEKGDKLPWLKWLLTSGTNTEITDYMLGRGRGRAGIYIMVPSKFGWGVPPEYAGTKDDNMITRAIRDSEDEMLKEIERIMER